MTSNRFKIHLIGVVALTSLVWACTPKDKKELMPVNPKLYEQVDPFIGTDFHGHTFPGATSPNGLVQLSPDTRWEGWDACSGYHYSDNSLYGFAHTHLSGTGATDLSDVLFVPTNDPQLFRDSIAQRHLPKTGFSHKNESAHAGYYSVKMDNGIHVELTTTPLVGVHRYTYPDDAEQAVVIDLVTLKPRTMLETKFEQVNEYEVQGLQATDGWTTGTKVYFYARFSRPIQGVEVYKNGTLMPEATADGDSIRAILSFDHAATPLEAYVGLSTTSYEAAKANLESQLEGRTFDEVQTANEEAWQEVLSQIEVPMGDKRDLTVFYTALYHAYIAPNRTSDVAGTYLGNDGQLHSLPEGQVHYSTLSLWDTYRTLHPLLTLMDHELVDHVVWSMLRMYDEQGELPIWPLMSGETHCMIGYHAVSVIADAYLRGIGSFDAERAMLAMVHSSNINKKGSDYYVEYGFIPADRKSESVSCTLEYTYDDWVIAMMAKAMGKTDLYDTYRSRALNYIRLFDGSTGFFRGRNFDGSWEPNFDPYAVSRNYTEATAWHYRYAPQHDINGLIQMHGGREAFIQSLDNMFGDDRKHEGELQDITGLLGQYAHGNEPSHHVAYLYTYAGQPWKTQELTRRLLDEMYSSEPDGIVGNEDCGQMSAWYVMSAMGFYPVTPGSGEYILTTPLFPKLTLHTATGNELVIKANSPYDNRYIKSVSLNGKKLDRLFITYDEIMAGGELKFELTDEPVKDYAVEEEPYSLTTKETASTVYTTADLVLFEDQVTVDLASATPNSTIYYTLDGTAPTAESTRYEAPFEVSEDVTIKAVALAGGEPSSVSTMLATKAVFKPAVEATNLQDGAQFRLYEGTFASVDEIAAGKLVKSDTSDKITNELRQRDDDYGLIFEGLIQVPRDGVYEFILTSDDGSVMEIDDTAVVLNYGSHAYVSATGKVALAAGPHHIRVRYWQGKEGHGLDAGMRMRGENKYQALKLYHEQK